jgi:hypothetical protein
VVKKGGKLAAGREVDVALGGPISFFDSNTGHFTQHMFWAPVNGAI